MLDRKACELCGEQFLARSGRAMYCERCSPRRRGGGGGSHVKSRIRCAMCRKVSFVTKSARFCSTACWHEWKRRPLLGPQDPRQSALVLKYPWPVDLVERLIDEWPGASSGRVWIAGRCRRCDEPFVIVDQVEARYCSMRCARADGKDRRRTKQRSAITENVVYRNRIFERDGWRCQLCGRKVDRRLVSPHPMSVVLDHLVPLAVDGLHDPVNVQCAHKKCNEEKGAGVFGAGEQLRLIGSRKWERGQQVSDPERAMSVDQRQAVSDWLRSVGDLLRLRDREIRVHVDPPTREDSEATCYPHSSYPCSWVSVDARLLRRPEEDVRRALVHELMHMHHGDLDELLGDVMVAAGVDGPARKLVDVVVERFVEQLVDTFARIVIDHAELPPLADVIDARPADLP